MHIVGMKEVAELVRTTRKKQGATQIQLAQIANVGTRFVRDVEDGKESVHFGKLMRVLAILGIKMEMTCQNG